MKTGKWSIWLASLLVISLMITGYFAIAAEYGGKDDPLVTLSYVNEVLSPEMEEKLDAVLAEKQQAFDAAVDEKVAASQKKMDAALASYQSALTSAKIDEALVDAVAARVLEEMTPEEPEPEEESSWEVVKVPAGRKVVCGIGCEIVLRIGTATVYAGGTPGLVDLSDATTREAGQSLIANHLYLTTIQDRGLSTADGCTVLLNGPYTIQ